MISQHTFKQTIDQINAEFARLAAKIERLENQVSELKKPKIGRPKKEAA